MSQQSQRSGEGVLPFPDFHEDLFADDPPEPHPRRWRIIISSALLALLLLGVVLAVVVLRRPHIVYQAQRVTEGDLMITVNASGLLYTPMYTVNFVGNGKLAEIAVNVGQQVKKNQILAKLDATSLQNAVNEARANVSAAQTALNNARANYEAISSATVSNVTAAQNALNSANNFLALVRAAPTPDPLVQSSAQADVDAATQQLARSLGQQQTQTASAQGAINTAQATLNTAQAQLASAQYNLNNAVLKAPHDGTVASINGTVGSVPGSTFIQIMDLTQTEVQVNVDASSINSVAVGNVVKFSLDAYPHQFFNGSVATILPLSQSASNATTYSVLINISATSVPSTIHFFPGMIAHATITTNDLPDAVMVPERALDFARAAVEPHPETNHQSLISHAQAADALTRASDMLQNLQQTASYEQPAYVLELDGQGKIVIRPVVIGLTNGGVYEVLDGLSTNNMVLIGARMDGK